MLRQTSSILCLMLLTLWSFGCAPESGSTVPLTADDVGHDHHGHDHGEGHAHPETLGEGIAELTKLRDFVSKAFAGGDEDAAHGPLHEVGHLLEDVSKLADASKLSDEAKATIDGKIETLFELFGAVDKKMHGDDDGKEYSEVSSQIDEAIAAIKKEADAVAGDHDHDHHGEKHAEEHGDHADKDHEEAHGDHEGEEKENAPESKDDEEK